MTSFFRPLHLRNAQIFPAGDGDYSPGPTDESNVVSKSKITVSSTPPLDPNINDIWIDTSS